MEEPCCPQKRLAKLANTQAGLPVEIALLANLEILDLQVCVRVCARERGGGKRERRHASERASERVCVCLCVVWVGVYVCCMFVYICV